MREQTATAIKGGASKAWKDMPDPESDIGRIANALLANRGEWVLAGALADQAGIKRKPLATVRAQLMDFYGFDIEADGLTHRRAYRLRGEFFGQHYVSYLKEV